MTSEARWFGRLPRLAIGAACALVAGSAVSLVAERRPVDPVTPPPQARPAGPADAAVQRALLDRYCVGCHSSKSRAQTAPPMALDTLDVTNVAAHAEQWEKVVAKLRAGLMPPAGMPRPEKAVIDGLSGWIETEIDRAAAAQPNPGRTDALHRLNRAEYQNAVRDLLHLDVDIAGSLPADDVSAGFDNVAGALTMSPTLMDRYLSVAQRVSRLAVGTPAAIPAVDYFRVADDLRQDDHLPNMPLGTRGGTRVRYTFPVDGEYRIKVRLARDLNEQVPSYLDEQLLEVSLDGRRLQVFSLPPARRLTGRALAGEPPAAASPVPADAGATAAPPAALRQALAAPSVLAGDQTTPAPEKQRPGAAQAPETERLPANARDVRNRADQNWDVTVTVPAGEHDVVATFLRRSAAVDETPRLPFLRPFPAGNNVPETRMGAALRSVEISGPHGAAAAGDTRSRRRIFVCRPAAPSSPASSRTTAGDAACATTILSTVARRAYRRPVAEADVAPLLTQYREGAAQGGFEAGIERALRRVLVSPEFLYRVELDPGSARPGTSYRISDLELASRLSFFLWSSIPDDELLDVATRGNLRKPAVLTAQVTRMLADRRSQALVDNFAGQWLFLRNVPITGPTPADFPDFDDSLRRAFRTETELFFGSMLREDRPAIDLLGADYTFLNERLARHYGIRTVKGSHFRRYTWERGTGRRGLLGQGSVLTLTSYPDRTSPVVRGKWVLENLLGTPPPPPLPDVGDLKPTDGSGGVLSMRERLARHRASPQCASCHSMLDPLGLALENYDAVGKWRTRDEAARPIDASTTLPDGTKVTGVDGLRDALLARSDRFLTTLTGKLMTYALGRPVEYYDAPAIREVLRHAAPDGYRLGTGLVMGIVQSRPFQTRRTQS